MMELFFEPFRGKLNPLRTHNLQDPSLPSVMNINLISIDYGFRPRLRCRLTPRINLAQKPLDFRRRSFHFIVTYVSIRTSDTSRISHSILHSLQNVPLPVIIFEKIINPQIRYMILAPLHLRRNLLTGELLRYL